VIRDFTALTHEAWLDTVEHTPLRVAEPLRGNRTLPVRASLRDRFSGSDTTTLNLVHGREAVIFLRDTQADDMADLDPRPNLITGQVTFKDQEDRTLGTQNLIYLPGTSPKKIVNADARPRPARDERPPAEQLADTLYQQRLTFIRSNRARRDAASQEHRAALLVELRAERPDDPAPIFEAALDQALAAGLAGPSWGRLGQAVTPTDKNAAPTSPDEDAAASTDDDKDNGPTENGTNDTNDDANGDAKSETNANCDEKATETKPRAPDPTAHAYNATLLVLGGYAVLHALVALLMQAFLAARIARGFISQRRRAEPPIVSLWTDYLAASAALVLAAAHVPGFLA
jgi:hypothetical protein